MATDFDHDGDNDSVEEGQIILQEKKMRWERAIAMRSFYAAVMIIVTIFISAYAAPPEVWLRIVEAFDFLEWSIIMPFSIVGAFMGLSQWTKSGSMR